MKTLATTTILMLLGVMCADSLKAMDFKELELKFEIAEAAAMLPVSKLNEQYDAQLQALAAKAQAEGNLEKVLAINKEKKGFETALTATDSGYDDLNRLNKIYYRERRKLRPKILEKQLKLLNTFEKSIRQLQSDLTKGGEIAAAVALKTELSKTVKRQESIRAQIEEISGDKSKRKSLELMAMLEGTWTFTTTGNKFQIGADGTLNGGKDGARVEIVESTRRIVRVNAHLFRLSDDGTQLSGKGLKGGSRHLAKKRK